MIKKILLVLMLFIVAAPVCASTYTVNSTLDQVDANAGNDICATAGNVCTLRAAVQEANAHAGIDTISLPAGLFRLLLVGSGEDLAATGDLDLTETAIIQGAGMDQTIINGLYGDRIFHLINNTDFTLNGLTLMRGSDPGGGPGGAVYAQASTGTITFESVHGMDLFGGTGGAVYHLGSLSVKNSVFEDNQTSGGGPGGVFYLSAGSTETVTIEGSDFFSCNAGSGPGGVLFASGDYTTTITDSDFDSNSSGVGGAIYLSIGDGDLTVAGSNFTDNSSGAGPGGGMFVSGGAIAGSISTGTFNSNTAGVGGVIYFSSSSTGALSITDSTMNLNSGGTGPGGAAFFSTNMGNLTLTNSTLMSNSAGVGGAIYASTSGTGGVQFTDSTLEENQTISGPGGGAYISVSDDVVFNRSIFRNNSSGSGPGGGAYVSISGAGDTTISDSSFEGNIAISAPGGGLYNSSGNDLTTTNSLFAMNTATGLSTGGAIYSSQGGDLTVTNSTISGNSTGNIGGGIFFSGLNGTLLNTTFFENAAATMGASIYYSAVTFTIQNSILASPILSVNCDPVIATSGNHNIDDDGSCGLVLAGDSAANPQLDILAENGGFTKTHALMSTSPAIDAFDNNLCPLTDQRGVARPSDGDLNGVARCDKGAFEYNDVCPADPDKLLPGICGCGVPDTDANANGITDCISESDLSEQLGRLSSLLNKLKVLKNLAKTKERAQAIKTLLNDEIVPFFELWGSTITLTDPALDVTQLFNTMKKAVKKGVKYKNPNFSTNKNLAKKAIKKLKKKLAIP